SGTDDVASFKQLAEEEKLWVHVDAAYAGAAWSLEEFRKDAQAVSDVATSVNMNGSKWFLCGFDSAFLWVRDRKLLLDVFSASDAFMADVEHTSIYNPEFKDWSVPLGRRFRSLRIWMVFEYFGTNGLRSYIRDAIEQ
ncbi:TDC2, partial [Symbiodinium sp. CCMP2456]